VTIIDPQPAVSDLPKPNEPSSSSPVSLSFRLALTAMVASGLVNVAGFFLTSWALSHLDSDRLEVVQFSSLLFPFLICAALVATRGSFRHFLSPCGTNAWTNAVVGLVIGLVASLAILPVAFGKTDLLLERMVAFSAYQMRPWGLLGLALLILGLPIVGELVFRGIALEELGKHFSFPVAAAITCGMYALFWPALNPLSRVVFAALSSACYRKTGSLLPSVIANAILATEGCFAALWHAVR